MNFSTRSLFATIVGSLVFLTACGSSPPPGDEFAKEVIENQTQLPESVRKCMYEVVDDFELTADEKAAGVGSNLDEVAEKAADGNDSAKAIMSRFQADLASCNQPG